MGEGTIFFYVFAITFEHTKMICWIGVQVWDEVTTCSKRCKSVRKRMQRRGEIAPRAVEEWTTRESRKAMKKKLKEERRLARQGLADNTKGQKPCMMCQRPVDVLIRCTIDVTAKWNMVCGKCWNKVSGGVVDGDDEHPFYRYGGLWRNRHVRSS